MLTKEDLSKINSRIEIIVKRSLDAFETRITKKLNLIISLIENNYINHEGRIIRIEKHLNIN